MSELNETSIDDWIASAAAKVDLAVTREAARDRLRDEVLSLAREKDRSVTVDGLDNLTMEATAACDWLPEGKTKTVLKLAVGVLAEVATLPGLPAMVARYAAECDEDPDVLEALGDAVGYLAENGWIEDSRQSAA